MAGIVATTAIQPIDMVKVRMQLSGEGGKGGNARPLTIGRQIVREEGARALYKGLGAAYLRQVTYGGIRGLLKLLWDFVDAFWMLLICVSVFVRIATTRLRHIPNGPGLYRRLQENKLHRRQIPTHTSRQDRLWNDRRCFGKIMRGPRRLEFGSFVSTNPS